MPSTQGAPAPVQKENVEQEIGYIGARLREKSTYGGLAVAVGLGIQLLMKLDPSLAQTLAGAGVDTIVSALSYGGMALGIAIGIFLPEKGSKAVIALLIGAAAAFAVLAPHSADAQVRHTHVPSSSTTS